MTRRASLPGVDELFRSSRDRAAEAELAEEAPSLQIAKTVAFPGDRETGLQIFEGAEVQVPAVSEVQPAEPEAIGKRPRHDEKVTFYCTASDLTRIERARLALRADYKLASDRGRIVRAALAEILDDFERRGEESALVARLRSKGSLGEL